MPARTVSPKNQNDTTAPPPATAARPAPSSSDAGSVATGDNASSTHAVDDHHRPALVAAIDATTPPRCPRHAHLPAGTPAPPCGACKDARLAWQREQTNRATLEQRRRRAHAAARATCPLCDEYGWKLDPATGETLNPAVKCNHTGAPGEDLTWLAPRLQLVRA
ncbi:hypothetical protein [Corynebacterium pyruviciproducens]|uniref:Uncharacterized protein n=1 Tax=Corynebacterium pyruviciproducens TaxID=598660 RepID=A0AAF0YWM3_9CORY|nr:hypothetical protein [Corynebacterium pyruviciproducens]WOT02881.1 hypothetical protein CYJ47_03680 [Corynebacterium pyruviciproducens]